MATREQTQQIIDFMDRTMEPEYIITKITIEVEHERFSERKFTKVLSGRKGFMTGLKLAIRTELSTYIY